MEIRREYEGNSGVGEQSVLSILGLYMLLTPWNCPR